SFLDRLLRTARVGRQPRLCMRPSWLQTTRPQSKCRELRRSQRQRTAPSRAHSSGESLLQPAPFPCRFHLRSIPSPYFQQRFQRGNTLRELPWMLQSFHGTAESALSGPVLFVYCKVDPACDSQSLRQQSKTPSPFLKLEARRF